MIEGELWKKAMEEEMESFRKNETWDLVTLHDGNNPIHSKWVFKRYTNVARQAGKFKAKLVAKGYSQVEGVEFGEMFFPIAKLASIRVVLSLAVGFDLEIEKMDIKTTFLHGDLE